MKNKYFIIIILIVLFFLARYLGSINSDKTIAGNQAASNPENSVQNDRGINSSSTVQSLFIAKRENIPAEKFESISVLSHAPKKNETKKTAEIINDENIDINKETNFSKVAKVVDGDTIDIDINSKVERIRLIGLNTPETVDPRKTVECFGKEASAKAKELLANQKVKIAADATQGDRDKYGRLLRYIWRGDGLFFNLEMIKQGYGYEYTYNFPYKYQAEFKAAQKFAEQNKLGLWADNVCENFSAPKNTQASQGVAPPNPKCAIKGNISSKGEKIYHLPNCDSYAKTAINENTGEKWFCSEADAVKAGWRKAKNCS